MQKDITQKFRSRYATCPCRVVWYVCESVIFLFDLLLEINKKK